MGAIGHDNEVDRQAVGGPRLRWAGDGHQRSSGSNQACGPLPDVAAEDIENQIDSADVFEDVVLEVDELLDYIDTPKLRELYLAWCGENGFEPIAIGAAA